MVSIEPARTTIDVRMLLPEQAAKAWPLIEAAIKRTLPEDNGSLKPENIATLYRQIMQAQFQVWVGFDANRPVLMVITCCLDETGTERKVLLIYTMTSVDGMPFDFFTQGLEVLKAYARSIRCSEIWAYSNNKTVIRLAKDLGANTDWVQIRFKVE